MNFYYFKKKKKLIFLFSNLLDLFWGEKEKEQSWLPWEKIRALSIGPHNIGIVEKNLLWNGEIEIIPIFQLKYLKEGKEGYFHRIKACKPQIFSVITSLPSA